MAYVKRAFGHWLKLWVGATRVEETKEFEWVTGARLKEEDKGWSSGYPSDGGSGKDCLVKYSARWLEDAYNDAKCINKYRPLCEVPGLYFPAVCAFG
jgi:hypothetical protein